MIVLEDLFYVGREPGKMTLVVQVEPKHEEEFGHVKTGQRWGKNTPEKGSNKSKCLENQPGRFKKVKGPRGWSL